MSCRLALDAHAGRLKILLIPAVRAMPCDTAQTALSFGQFLVPGGAEPQLTCSGHVLRMSKDPVYLRESWALPVLKV